VLNDDNFPRASAAQKASLHAGVAFPIEVEREGVGVVEFFSRQILPPDPDLLRLMMAVGSQIGQFVQRKRAVEALSQRVAELAVMARALKRGNEDLDQFAYVTSHDLKAPLRGISHLSAWIEEDMSERLTPEARHQMELLRGRVRRMENLIDGILEYSRIGRVGGKIEQVDVAILLADVIDLLDPPADFTIQVLPGMPTLVTDRLRLEQVFMNLIGNAIKHHQSPAEGHVSIQCRPLEVQPFYEFAVRDDGPGIAPQYHERIFVIFQTLVARDTIEGAGVGLSLVKKTVEHFGGSVRVESEPGEGSTFIFTWPKQLAQQGD
jgi:light-regulated signal transduction histidine kinase (bacteriophytochrome)